MSLHETFVPETSLPMNVPSAERWIKNVTKKEKYPVSLHHLSPRENNLKRPKRHKNQCVGSGRIRNYLQDPDPDPSSNFGSGSEAGKDPKLDFCLQTELFTCNNAYLRWK